MGKIFDRYDAAPVKGKDITIGSIFPEVFVSDTDEVLCYTGVCLRDILRIRNLFAQPYYIQGVHSNDPEIVNGIKGFYRITDGCVVLDSYVDNLFHGSRTYKKIDAIVAFSGYKKCYAVCVDGEEDKALTRRIFGFTADEIDSLLKAYARTVKIYREDSAYPKLIRSKKYEHFCDIANFWIPEEFPYVAFCESEYDFSHVSLWGFYRHLQLLTGCRADSPISRALLKFGVDERVLKRLFDIGSASFHHTKVTKDILNGI